MSRLFLSPPHVGAEERALLLEAFDSNWIAPLGPQVDAFEAEFAVEVGAEHAVALSSGTAALHLALILSGVGPGDEVLCSSLTFVASANAIRYQGATPCFIDSDPHSWNLDPNLLAEELAERRSTGRPAKALVLVHLYGQCADLDPILELCLEHELTLIEDAAEALGARHGERQPGGFGRFGVFSFNGNKIITTSGGGMLTCRSAEDAAGARKLATQARELAPHYEHVVVGYNYRLSNLLAAVGRGQLRQLQQRVAARRAVFDRYADAFAGQPGIEPMPEAPWGRCNRWLSVFLIDPDAFGQDREVVRKRLERHDIEARPVWKPMHRQPVYASCPMRGGAVSDRLFALGLCLPSGSALTAAEQEQVVRLVLKR